MTKKKIFAVIPVKKNSIRVKNKNFKKFNKKNLLIHKIEKLKKIKYIDKIIVNTDSDEAIDIAKFYNVGEINTLLLQSVLTASFGVILVLLLFHLL